MKIVHVLDHSLPLHSGYVFRTMGILEGQRNLGWETYHLTSPKHRAPYIPEETIDGWKFYRTPEPKSTISRLPVLKELSLIAKTAGRLEEIARRIRPDILHAHSPALNAAAAIRAGRKLRIPVVYEVRAFWEDAAVDHGTSSEWGLRYRATRLLETWALKRVDAITTICEGLKQEILGRGFEPDKVTVIPNAVDVSRFKADDGPDPNLVRSLGLADNRVIGFIGSFYAYEGLDLLLEALPKMKAALPNIKVLLVGGGPEEERLKSLARNLELEDNVIFTGRVSQVEVNRYYNLIEVLVYPRRSMRLTELVTPLKPLEAMAQECIVLASDVGGHGELIEDGKTGFFFKSGQADELTKRLIEVMSNSSEWPRVKAGGRKFVEEERSWPASVSRYRKVYKNVLEGCT